MSSDIDSRVWRLLDRYKDLEPDRRSSTITELDRYRAHRADGLSPFLERLGVLLLWESGSNAASLGDLLEDSISEHADRIDTETLRSLSDLSRASEGPSMQVGLSALRELCYRNPEAIDDEFSTQEIEEWLKGKPEERVLGYRILGTQATKDAISRLSAARKSEDSPACEAAQAGLEDIAEIAARWLSGQQPETGAKKLEQLADKCPEVAVRYQEELQKGLTENSSSVVSSCATALIRLGYSEYCNRIDHQALLDAMDEFDRVNAGRAAGVIVGGQEAIDTNIVPSILDQIESIEDDTRQRIYLVTLLEIAKRSPEPIANHVDRLRDLDSQLPGQARSDYIDLLGEIISAVEDPGKVAPLMLREFDTSGEEHIKKASRHLADTNLYPLPDIIHLTRNSENESLSSAAHKISQRSEAPDFSINDHLGEYEAGSLLEGLQSALHSQVMPGRWEPLSLPSEEKKHLAAVREQFQKETGGYLLLPHDVPEMGILPAAELALTGLEAPRSSVDIVLYTPGTGRQWGTFEDVKSTFREVGLSTEQGITTAALPLDEVVSICRIGGSQITEWKQTNSSARIILTKSLEDLAQVEADAVVCNFLGRRPGNFETQLEALQTELNSVPVFSLYSFTSKIEASQTLPEYGYPEQIPEASSQLSKGPPSELPTSDPTTSELSTPGDIVTTHLSRLQTSREIAIEQLEADEITRRLQRMQFLAIQMDDEETEYVASEFRKQTRFIQGLPVPLELWDEWVREESVGAGPYANDASFQRASDVEDLREDPPRATVPGTVYEYLIELRALFDILRRKNPIFQRLLDEIETCITSDEQLAVLFGKRSTQQAFEYALREDQDLSISDLNGHGVYIVRLDGLRELHGIDNLIMTSPVAPSETQFYLAPLYDTIRLIVYDEKTDEYVSDCITEQLNTLKSRRELSEDSDWPAMPAIDTATRAIDTLSEISSEAVSAVPDSRDITQDQPLTEMWAQFSQDDRAETEATANSFDTAGDTAAAGTVRVLTEQGTELMKPSNESVLIERHQGPLAGTQSIWSTMGELQPGDDFVLVPSSIRERLFRDGLEAVYGEDLEGTDLMDGLRVWLECLSGITEAYDGVSTIYTLLKQNGIDSSEAAVEDWFDAVSAADDPLDLPMNSELRTGPDSAADIETIGNTFEYPALVEKAEVVARAMELSQFRNSSKGKELNDWVVSEIMDGDPESLKDVSGHTVDTVQHLGREG